jgi:hypothetical protein
MSPNRFSVSITSNRLGSLTRCIAAASTRTLDVRVAFGDFGDDPAPQAARSHHVRLVHARHAALPAFGGVEGDAGHPVYLLPGVDGEVARPFVALLLLTEVRAAGELAHDQDVYTLHDLLL